MPRCVSSPRLKPGWDWPGDLMPGTGAPGTPPVDGGRVRRAGLLCSLTARGSGANRTLCGVGMLETCCLAALTFASTPGDSWAPLSAALRACGGDPGAPASGPCLSQPSGKHDSPADAGRGPGGSVSRPGVLAHWGHTARSWPRRHPALSLPATRPCPTRTGRPAFLPSLRNERGHF